MTQCRSWSCFAALSRLGMHNTQNANEAGLMDDLLRPLIRRRFLRISIAGYSWQDSLLRCLDNFRQRENRIAGIDPRMMRYQTDVPKVGTSVQLLMSSTSLGSAISLCIR